MVRSRLSGIRQRLLLQTDEDLARCGQDFIDAVDGSPFVILLVMEYLSRANAWLSTNVQDWVLRVLRALNEHDGSSVSRLAELTQVLRPALLPARGFALSARLCPETLESGTRQTDPLVRSLSDGFKDEDRLRHAASPVMEARQRDVV